MLIFLIIKFHIFEKLKPTTLVLQGLKNYNCLYIFNICKLFIYVFPKPYFAIYYNIHMFLFLLCSSFIILRFLFFVFWFFGCVCPLLLCVGFL